MPFSSEQRRRLKICIRSNTFYRGGTYIVDSIERAIDSNEKNSVEDLFMPNDIIDTEDKGDFWFKMASIICSNEVKGWHVLEYGKRLNVSDSRERYIYTWQFNGNTYKFYTKKLRHGHCSDLVWYISSHKIVNTDSVTDEDTDSDEIVLQL